eukprot:4483375-Prymnesium_polylepis.1
MRRNATTLMPAHSIGGEGGGAPRAPHSGHTGEAAPTAALAALLRRPATAARTSTGGGLHEMSARGPSAARHPLLAG